MCLTSPGYVLVFSDKEYHSHLGDSPLLFGARSDRMTTQWIAGSLGREGCESGSTILLVTVLTFKGVKLLHLHPRNSITT